MKKTSLIKKIFSCSLVFLTAISFSSVKAAEPVESGTASSASVESTAPNSAFSAIEAFLREYQKGIRNIKVYLKDAGVHLREFYAEYDDNNGEHHLWMSNVFYDTSEQKIYGGDNKGALSLGFDWDLNQMVLYSSTDTWLKNYGFCRLYDMASPAVSYNYRTVRVKFRYRGMDWMVQFWKGQYVITVGGEFAVYHKPADRLSDFYDCAVQDGMMPMSMKLYQCNRILFERPLQTHWCMSGYQGGFCLPFQLRLEGSIKFPSADMKNAFVAAAKKMVWSDFRCTAKGNTVSFIW